MKDEEKLYLAIKSNSQAKIEKAFKDIYYQYFGLLSFIAAKYLKSNEDVEETVNDAFINFFNNINNTNFSSIKYYLVNTTKNLAINKLKANKELIPFDEKINNESYQISTNKFILDLKAFLTDEEFSLLNDYLINDYSSIELAKKYKTSSSNIRMKIKRIIKKIQTEFKGVYYE